jgi:hypothetical protein
MDRLEREISPSGYLVGASFTVAELTAAALLYGVVRPPEFPYPMFARDDLPAFWREFLDSLAQRPGGQWVTETYRRHRALQGIPFDASPTRTELGITFRPATQSIADTTRWLIDQDRLTAASAKSAAAHATAPTNTGPAPGNPVARLPPEDVLARDELR